MSTEKSSIKLSKLNTGKPVAEPSDSSPSRPSSTQGTKPSSLCKDTFADDPVPVSLPSYPEVMPFEHERAYPQSDMVSPLYTYPQPPSHASSQPRRGSEATASVLKATDEDSSKSMRYPWHRTRLALRGLALNLFHAALIAAFVRYIIDLKGFDYIGYWDNSRDGWSMFIASLVCVSPSLGSITWAIEVCIRAHINRISRSLSL